MTNSDDILNRLLALHPKRIDLSLSRVHGLLEKLDHPERALPPVVHVAGTNGKGSVIAFMRAALEAAGYSVHVHTSPHLVRFHERIRLNGELIDEDYLQDILELCERVNNDEPITFFEITTVAALLAFAETPGDVVLLETGLGGRLDATNVIKEPRLCVITPISLDHQDFLGDTLKDIAQEKAGILKRAVPAVIANQPDDVMDVIRARAAETACPLFEQNQDWSVTTANDKLVYKTVFAEKHLSMPNLTGPHQIENAGIAVAALDRLGGFSVSDDAINSGLENAVWPARLQKLSSGPLFDLARPEDEIWLDGGHNMAAAEAIADQARVWKKMDNRPLHLVFAMLNSKNPDGFLKILMPFVQSLYCVSIPGAENTLESDELIQSANRIGLDGKAAVSVAAAVADILKNATGPVRILISGSLYLAGSVLSEHG